MKNRILRIAGFAALLLVVAAAALAIVVSLRWDRTFDAPMPEIHASTDPAVIERGRYIAQGPGHCMGCHVSPEEMHRVERGEVVPLAGGNPFKIPLGTFYAPNLTPDPVHGIGRRTDGELARILRHDVRPDGRAAFPIMEFLNMSDEDITAVISFLRSQKPVNRAVPERELTPFGKAIYALVLKPRTPDGTPRKTSPPQGATLERGEYLVTATAGCVGCHTQRNLKDGSYVGAKLSGGFAFDIDNNPAAMLVTPNLTPAPKTGRITNWTEDQFVARFKSGVGLAGTHMPWPLYARMADDDLRAMYRYLHQLPPTENETGPSFQMKKK